MCESAESAGTTVGSFRAIALSRAPLRLRYAPKSQDGKAKFSWRKRSGRGSWIGVTTHELQDLLLSRLVRQHGGDRRRWRSALGPIRLHDLATHSHCNWSIDASGSPRENAAIERMLDDVRGVHPIVRA